MVSCKSDCEQAGFLGYSAWIRGLVSWAARVDCGSEFYSHIWFGHCLFVYSVSQKRSWTRGSSFGAKSGSCQGQRDLPLPAQQDSSL